MNPTNRCTKENIEEWLTPTLEKEALKNYSIKISGSSVKGDGYLGDITFVEVRGKTETDEEKVYNFVVKCGKKSKVLREKMPIRSVFENEIYFYTQVLPELIEFQTEKGIEEPFNNTPKCYDTLIMEDMEVLILENMKRKEFDVHDRRQPMDKDHIRTVIETYGKLHAVSFALRDQKPELFKKLSGRLVDVLKLMNEKADPEHVYHPFTDIINLAKKENELEVIKKASSLDKKVKKLHDITDPSDPYAVMLHGDCWNNNFMFKYQDEANTKISEICLIDFQLSRLASPVYDLSYFLFTCLSGEDVKDFDEINLWYYESLSNFLRELGSNPDKMFPFEELLNQWKTFSLFGLIMMPSIIRICLSDSDEVPDLVEAAESGADFATTFLKTVRNSEEYGKRTIPIVKLAIEKGFAN